MTPSMASEQEVKRYLAYWFQLGKKVLIRNGQIALQPRQVIKGDRYSQEFEDIWQQIVSPESGNCYLEGTDQTIAELLTPQWDVSPCARCEMPVPVRRAGMPPDCCPCFELDNWPNTDLPNPREPVCSQERLGRIRDRLSEGNEHSVPQEELPTALNTDSSTASEAASISTQEYLSRIRARLYKASIERS